MKTQDALIGWQNQLAACRLCPKMIRPVVHGAPVLSRILLIGQAPGPREGQFGRPFAWTAGKTLFRWFSESLGIDEQTFRARVYIAAVARCFPGKAKGGGDRRPEPDEIANCRRWLAGEVKLLKPALVLPVGTLAIEQVTGQKGPLTQSVGTLRSHTLHGQKVDVICLPHPSGASTWHRTEPGKGLLQQALRLIALHPEMQRVLRPEQPLSGKS